MTAVAGDLRCWSCGSTAVSEVRPRAWEARYVRCTACGHQCETGASATEQDEPYYEDESYFYFSPFSQWLSAAAATQRIGVLRDHLASGHILEIGPGSGHVVIAAERAGYTVSAVENSQVFAKHLRAHARAHVYRGLFDRLDFVDDQFDAVLSFHVIEHISDPVTHLQRIHNVTKQGGYLLLATPNSESWDRRICRSRWTGYSIGHVHLFSPVSLRHCLEHTGWEIISIVTPEFPWQLLWTIKTGLRPRKVSTESAGSTVKRMPVRLGAAIVQVFGAITKPIRFVQQRLAGGNEIFTVARKASPGRARR